MGRLTISVLGTASRACRYARLGKPLDAVRDAIDRLLLGARRPPLTVNDDGLQLHGYLRHRSFLASLVEGEYETRFRRVFERVLEPAATVVDGGAHIGRYTVLASRHLSDAGRVVAFEPDPYNFAALSFNVRANQCRNVTLLQKALSNVRERTAFQQNLGTISSSLVPREDVGPFRHIYVEATTLDDELRDVAVDSLLVKLDVEGAEPMALEGMTETVMRSRSVVLFVEVNPAALRYSPYTAEDIVANIVRLGLCPVVIDANRATLIPVTAETLPPGKLNLFCRR